VGDYKLRQPKYIHPTAPTDDDDDDDGVEIHRRRHGGSPAAVRPHREDARVRAVSASPSG